MKPSRLAATALALAAMACAPAYAFDCNPSFPNNGVIPSSDDITVPGGVLACAGFYDKNLNSGSAESLAIVQDLLASSWSGYGLTTTGPLEQINTNASTIDFSLPLSGLTLVGVHWGNFGGPSSAAGNVSALYLFNAGQSLDTFAVNVTGGLSSVAVWTTSPVPEPSTYALALAGLAGIGFVARRRRT